MGEGVGSRLPLVRRNAKQLHRWYPSQSMNRNCAGNINTHPASTTATNLILKDTIFSHHVLEWHSAATHKVIS